MEGYVPCLCIRWINIGKMTILHKEVYIFNEIPTKLLIAFFSGVEQIILHSESQKTLNSQF